MATVAFAAAATEAGFTGAAYAVAVTMGSIIDQAFLMPALFPADPIEGMRVGEINVMGADEGMGVAMVFGTKARVAGQIIWAGELQEVSHSTKVGKSGKSITYSYYVDCAIAMSYVGSDATTGVLDKVDAVFADEKRIYDATNTGQLALSVTADGIGAQSTGYPLKHYLYFDATQNPTIEADVYDKFNVGDELDLSLFAQSANNDSNDRIMEKTVVWVGNGKSAAQHLAFRMSLAKTDEASQVGLDRRLQRFDSTWADGVQQNGLAPTLHLGDQTAYDAHMVSVLGSNWISAWKDMSYMVIDSLVLTDFGSRIPNFEFVLSAASGLQVVRGCFDAILNESSLQASEYDTSGISSQVVIGYAVRTPIATVKALQPLMLAFDIIAQERGGVLYFFDRSDQVANTISLADDFLGAIEGSFLSGGQVEVQEAPRTQRLGEVTVAYIDANSDDFKAGLARAQFMSHSTAADRDSPHRWEKMSVNLPMTLEEETASSIAMRLLHSTHSDSLRFKFTLPPRYLKLQENDRVSFSTGGVSYNALILKVDVGWHNIVEIEAALDVAVEQTWTVL